jgi:hypothetical protein
MLIDIALVAQLYCIKGILQQLFSASAPCCRLLTVKLWR